MICFPLEFIFNWLFAMFDKLYKSETHACCWGRRKFATICLALNTVFLLHLGMLFLIHEFLQYYWLCTTSIHQTLYHTTYSFFIECHCNNFTEALFPQVNDCTFDPKLFAVWFHNEVWFSHFWKCFPLLPSQFIELCSCLFCIFPIFLWLTAINSISVTIKWIITLARHWNIHLLGYRKTFLPYFCSLFITWVQDICLLISQQFWCIVSFTYWD